MAKTWTEVVSSPEYNNLTSGQQQKVKQMYWVEVVRPKVEAQNLNPAQQANAYSLFMTGKRLNLGKTTSKKKLTAAQKILPQMLTQTEMPRGQQTVWGEVFNRPGAAVRGAIQNIGPTGKSPLAGYVEGAQYPEEVPLFQDLAAEKAMGMGGINKLYSTGKLGTPGKLGRVAMGTEEFLLGLQGAGIGMLADVLTNPGDVALMLAGQTSAGKVAMEKIAGTKAGKAVGEFLTKPRSGPVKLVKQAWKKFKAHPHRDTTRIKNAIAFKKDIWSARGKKLVAQDAAYFDDMLNKSKQVMDENIAMLEKDVQLAAEQGVADVQTRFKDFNRNYSQTYGGVLDDITDSMVKNKNTAMTLGEQHDMLLNTIRQAEASDLKYGRSSAKIQELFENKYWIKKKVPKPDGTFEIMNRDPNQVLNFKDVVKDMREITSTVKKQSWAKGFTEDEVVAAIYRHNWGNYIAKNVPQFAELQSTSSRIIRVIQKTHQVFKPFKGEFDQTAGVNFLKRIGKPHGTKGAIDISQRNWLQVLEEGGAIGGESIPGIGKVSQPVTEATSKLGKAVQARESVGSVFKQKKSAAKLQRVTETQREIARWVDKLSAIEKKAIINKWKKAGVAAASSYLLYLVKKNMTKKLLGVFIDTETGYDTRH